MLLSCSAEQGCLVMLSDLSKYQRISPVAPLFWVLLFKTMVRIYKVRFNSVDITFGAIKYDYCRWMTSEAKVTLLNNIIEVKKITEGQTDYTRGKIPLLYIL